MKNVLSLGAGVQSSYLLLKSLRGELPPLDVAIFADTKAEPQAVYDWLEFLKSRCKVAGVPLAVVNQGDLKADSLNSMVKGYDKAKGERHAALPLFTLSDENQTKGMIRRQCTYEYKIRPIERYIRREVLGLQPRQRGPKDVQVCHWFGISWDERRRQRTSPDKWRQFWYPLVESHTTRHMCLLWFEELGLEPPRSACTFCPFHSNTEWRSQRDNAPEEWRESVAFDKAIRRCGGMRGPTFVHADRIPLDEVDLTNDADRGQLSLFENECEGMCGT